MALTQAQLESIQEKKEKFASIMKYIKGCWPDAQPEVLMAEDTKFGIVDKFLFEKSKPDKNGIHSNSKIVQHTFNSMKELILTLQKSASIFEGKTVIAFKPINDKYHYIVLRELNINKSNLEKYLLLM
jgi:hypothetical protein